MSWVFNGTYSGEAEEYVKRKIKKQYTFLAWFFSIVLTVSLLLIAVFMAQGDKTWIIISLSTALGGTVLINVILWCSYKRSLKCVIEIRNDGLYFMESGYICSIPFYKFDSIEYHDDFIWIADNYALQKGLLVQGSWEELLTVLKKIEDSLDTETPIYQLDEESNTEFFEARVDTKRIYEKFVTGVSLATPVGMFQYFVTFTLENDETVEYEVSKEWYEKMEEGANGTLVIVGGTFFAFGDGEDVS